MFTDRIDTRIVVELKVGVISRNRNTLDHVRTTLQSWDAAIKVMTTLGGVDQAWRIADEGKLDLLIVEGTRESDEDIVALERTLPRYPGLEVILLAPNHTPEFLRRGMRMGLREILPLPIEKDALIESIIRIGQRIADLRAPKRNGKIFSFVGSKGGSGATFLATNFAYALAAHENRTVAVIDLNCQFGDAAVYVSDTPPTSNLADVAKQIHRLDGAFLASSMLKAWPNLHVLAAPEQPEQALHIRPEQIDALLWTAASHYDYVIVDLGRSVDGISVRAMDHSQTIFIVMQLNLPSVRGAARQLEVLSGLGYGAEKIRLLVNRAEKKSGVSLDDVEKTLRKEVYRAIPNSWRAVEASVNQGVPLLKLTPRNEVARKLREMAADIVTVKKDKGGWLKSLLPG